MIQDKVAVILGLIYPHDHQERLLTEQVHLKNYLQVWDFDIPCEKNQSAWN